MSGLHNIYYGTKGRGSDGSLAGTNMRKEREGDKHQLHVNTLQVGALGWPCPAPDQYSLSYFLLNAFLTFPCSVCM